LRKTSVEAACPFMRLLLSQPEEKRARNWFLLPSVMATVEVDVLRGSIFASVCCQFRIHQ
jgi:hypothetical protein